MTPDFLLLLRWLEMLNMRPQQATTFTDFAGGPSLKNLRNLP